MASTITYAIDSISTDIKTATLVDSSVYDASSRGDFSVTVTGNRVYWNGDLGTALTIVGEDNNPLADQAYTVYLEGTPYNEDGHYRFNIQYDPANVPDNVLAEYDWNFVLTPNTEYNYANMLSEASEECCSVDFNIEKIKDLLYVGCFLDSIFVIKDRMNSLGSAVEFNASDAERLIRRSQTIYE